VVRKALSGVARMCHRTKEGFVPRFGRNRVIQVLVGSHGKEVVEAGLNELSTYGLLKQKSTNYLQELFREMEEAELIYSTHGQYPMIGLAELGVAVMQNVASFDLVWPEERRSRKGKEVVREPENEAPFDRDLYEVLRRTRAALAQEQGAVPHYVIFPDETLKAFARLKPSSIETARRIRGVGEVKASKYMGVFLRVIEEFVGV
jgi:ATP-dependent DNA helicase RecQ